MCFPSLSVQTTSMSCRNDGTLTRPWQIIPKDSPIILFFYSQISAYYSLKPAHYS